MCRVLKFVLSVIQKLFIKGLLYIDHYSGTGERFSEPKDKMFKAATVYHDLRMFKESGSHCIYIIYWKDIYIPQEQMLIDTHTFPHFQVLLFATFPHIYL